MVITVLAVVLVQRKNIHPPWPTGSVKLEGKRRHRIHVITSQLQTQNTCYNKPSWRGQRGRREDAAHNFQLVFPASIFSSLLLPFHSFSFAFPQFVRKDWESKLEISDANKTITKSLSTVQHLSCCALATTNNSYPRALPRINIFKS